MATKQRGRPKLDEHAINQKRMIIIASAKKLFKEQGVEAVSIRKIANASGLGTMTLYKYFETKREILHFIWLEFFDELLNEIRNIPDNLTALDRLHQKCERYLNYWILHPDRYRMVFLNEDRADSDDDFFVHHADMENQFNELFFQDLITVSHPESETDAEILSHELMCLLNGITLNLITISEFQWKSHLQILNNYLDRLSKN